MRGPVRLTLTDGKQLKALTAVQQTDFNYNHQTNKIVLTDLIVMINCDYKQLGAWRARAKLGLPVMLSEVVIYHVNVCFCLDNGQDTSN